MSGSEQESPRKRTRLDYSASTSDVNNAASSPVKSPSKISKSKSPKKPRKFGDLSEEDVLEKSLPDLIREGLDVLFIGINPSLDAAYVGHYYAGNSNHFWACMNESQLVPSDRPLSDVDDDYCLSKGIGFSCLVSKTTRAAIDLTKEEMKKGAEQLREKIIKYKPKIACFNGKGMYELFSGKKCSLGEQEDRLPDAETVIYVMPSTSARAASFPRASDKVKFFTELKQILKRMKEGT
ncbi:G/T mismatch-specific thymine DNA glycosylase-like [Corticium candelabrum]|uniref:G/T mismatch-specific thymine DNA glycosylase-like n=1 Tax=Corticium candelabrum TaxID=121492 RepID=UPI002E268295|nr:G/T mismatch-specific thymine DNA glycosylase-like [Corticium candelabrum]